MTVNSKPFGFLPPLNRPHISPKKGGNFFPRTQAFFDDPI